MNRKDPIQFWFDFSSSYAYFASLEIDAIAGRHGRSVLWRPFMLGAAFEKTGARGLSATPLKRDYARRDWQRIARLTAVPYSPPANHPRTALAATRIFYAVEEQSSDAAPAFARAVFGKYYVGELDTSDYEQTLALAETLGLDRQKAEARAQEQAFKDAVRRRGQGAVAGGIFGSPWFIVDGEPFWGWDRLAMLEAWIGRSGW